MRIDVIRTELQLVIIRFKLHTVSNSRRRRDEEGAERYDCPLPSTPLSVDGETGYVTGKAFSFG